MVLAFNPGYEGQENNIAVYIYVSHSSLLSTEAVAAVACILVVVTVILCVGIVCLHCKSRNSLQGTIIVISMNTEDGR